MLLLYILLIASSAFGLTVYDSTPQYYQKNGNSFSRGTQDPQACLAICDSETTCTGSLTFKWGQTAAGTAYVCYSYTKNIGSFTGHNSTVAMFIKRVDPKIAYSNLPAGSSTCDSFTCFNKCTFPSYLDPSGRCQPPCGTSCLLNYTGDGCYCKAANTVYDYVPQYYHQNGKYFHRGNQDPKACLALCSSEKPCTGSYSSRRFTGPAYDCYSYTQNSGPFKGPTSNALMYIKRVDPKITYSNLPAGSSTCDSYTCFNKCPTPSYVDRTGVCQPACGTGCAPSYTGTGCYCKSDATVYDYMSQYTQGGTSSDRGNLDLQACFTICNSEPTCTAFFSSKREGFIDQCFTYTKNAGGFFVPNFGKTAFYIKRINPKIAYSNLPAGSSTCDANTCFKCSSPSYVDKFGQCQPACGKGCLLNGTKDGCNC